MVECCLRKAKNKKQPAWLLVYDAFARGPRNDKGSVNDRRPVKRRRLCEVNLPREIKSHPRCRTVTEEGAVTRKQEGNGDRRGLGSRCGAREG